MSNWSNIYSKGLTYLNVIITFGLVLWIFLIKPTVMKRILTLSIAIPILLLFSFLDVHAQGCVAVRNVSCAVPMPGDSMDMAKPWQFSLGYRYLKSDRHFRGTHEEAERQEEHTEVINQTHSIDLSLNYAINPRWSIGFTLPLVHSNRSSLYEHGFDGDGDGERDRYSTSAYGIGDIRITGYYTVLDPHKHTKRNLILGLGMKMPTGAKGYTDVFYRRDGPYERPVDQSIQPGDGGWGINLELQFYSEIAKGLGVYANGFYLLNPMKDNGVDRTGNGGGRDYDRYFSVPDQFLGRLGLFYMVPKAGLSFNLGVRMEGVPVEDLLGKDQGYRRPGYTFSIEPGVSYRRDAHTFELNVPAALIRNRPQSVSDKIREQETGIPRNGDAAFADYLILITYGYKFGGKGAN